MNGAASCHWTETQLGYMGPHGPSSRRIRYDGKDVYVNQKTFLFGGHGVKAVEMPSGIYKYDFMCQLPPLLPASLESTHGNIRYNLKAVLDIAWAFDKQFKLQFTVVRNDDLNHQPELKFATRDEQIKRFCCLFCQSDPLMMTVTIPQSGYAPGQDILITVQYHNKSDVDVARTKISLTRMVHHNR